MSKKIVRSDEIDYNLQQTDIGNLYVLLTSDNSNVLKQVGIHVKKLLDLSK